MVSDIGLIVQHARQRKGLSVEDLSRKASVSVSSITALEAGHAGITTTELTRIAESLELSSRALASGREVSRAEPSVFLRHTSAAQDFHADDGKILDDALEQSHLLKAYRDLLDRQTPIRFSPFDASGSQPAREGYQLATDVRKALSLERTPLGDVRQIAEETFGFGVTVASLSSTRTVAVGVRDESVGAIVLNEIDPDRAYNPVLGRVHIAHELCHLLFDRSDGGLHIVFDVTADHRELRAEQRARGFAAELLLPLAGLKELIGPPKALREMGAARTVIETVQAHFDTPGEITINHLCNHGFIDHEFRSWLVDEGGRRRRGTISLPPTGARGILLQTLVREAHDKLLVTDGEAKSSLGLDILKPLPWDAA